MIFACIFARMSVFAKVGQYLDYVGKGHLLSAIVMPALFCVYVVFALVSGKSRELYLKNARPSAYLQAIPLFAFGVLNLFFCGFLPNAPGISECVSVIFGGLCEEMFFRSFLLSRLKNKFGKSALFSVLFVSVLFGALHMLNLLSGAGLPETLIQMAGAFSFGFSACVLTLKSKSVFPSAAAHLFVNLTACYSGNIGYSREQTVVFIVFSALNLIYGVSTYFISSSGRKESK